MENNQNLSEAQLADLLRLSKETLIALRSGANSFKKTWCDDGEQFIILPDHD